jgi:hypothetical protein
MMRAASVLHGVVAACSPHLLLTKVGHRLGVQVKRHPLDEQLLNQPVVALPGGGRPACDSARSKSM